MTVYIILPRGWTAVQPTVLLYPAVITRIHSPATQLFIGSILPYIAFDVSTWNLFFCSIGSSNFWFYLHTYTRCRVSVMHYRCLGSMRLVRRLKPVSMSSLSRRPRFGSIQGFDKTFSSNVISISVPATTSLCCPQSLDCLDHNLH